jgi:hypothetical protein
MWQTPARLQLLDFLPISISTPTTGPASVLTGKAQNNEMAIKNNTRTRDDLISIVDLLYLEDALKVAGALPPHPSLAIAAELLYMRNHSA